MKKYFEYMDERQVSDTLHQRLLELDVPKKQKHFSGWNKYNGVAAALAVALLTGPVLYAATRPEPLSPEAEYVKEDPGQPDLAIVEPGDETEPGMKTIGGYEVQQGEVVAYFMLPGIEYGMAEDMAEMAMDWDLPSGCTKRDLTQGDIAALFGTEENLSLHLGWEGYELTGWAAWYEDGSLWGMFLNGYKGPMDHFEFAFTTGDTYPPTCIVYGDGVVNDLWDVPVTAWGHDGKDGVSRRAEFLHDGYGFRFDLTATDGDNAAHLVSRLTRWVIVEGLAAENVTQDGAVLAHPWEANPNYSVGEPNWNDSAQDYDSDCPYCADGTVHTHPYDPQETAAPAPAGQFPDSTNFD